MPENLFDAIEAQLAKSDPQAALALCKDARIQMPRVCWLCGGHILQLMGSAGQQRPFGCTKCLQVFQESERDPKVLEEWLDQMEQRYTQDSNDE